MNKLSRAYLGANVRHFVGICVATVFLTGAIVTQQMSFRASSFASATAPCASSLVGSAQGVGATMSATDITALHFTNSGTASCTETGAPGLTIIDAAGATVLTAIPSASGPFGYYGTTPVTLAPGQVAVAYLASSYLADCSSGDSIRITMPDGANLAIGQLPTQAMCGGTLVISPLVPEAVPLFTTFDQPTSSGISPESDGTGYMYGTDSGSSPCSGHTISYNGITGQCGFYGGQIGAYWLDLSNCPSGGWGWIQSQANAANAAQQYGGTGTSAVYFVAGPGMDPNYDYTSGAPTSAQISAAESWGTKQADTAIQQYDSSTYNPYISQPTLFMDIEVGEGWEGKFTTNGGSTCYPGYATQNNNHYSPELNRDTFNSFYNTFNAYFLFSALGVYSDSVDWGTWFSGYSSLPHAYEWTNLDEATSEASSTNSPKSFSWSEANPQWFGGVSSSGSQALAWQWATPVYTPNQVDDLDQVNTGRFPL